MFDSALALSVWVDLSLPEIKFIHSRQQPQQHWSNSDAICARINLGNKVKVNLIPIVSVARLIGMNCNNAELRTGLSPIHQ